MSYDTLNLRRVSPHVGAEIRDIDIRAKRSSLSVDFVEELVRHPDHRFTAVPEGVTRFAEFQHRTGQVPIRMAAWQELFFPEAHGWTGS